jgi:hypothetical protein
MLDVERREMRVDDNPYGTSGRGKLVASFGTNAMDYA